MLGKPLVIAVTAATFAVLLPLSLHAQPSPLTVQPSTGNVGIGTNNPQSKLQVVGGAILLDNNQKVLSKNSGGALGNLINRQSDDKVFIGESMFVGDIILGMGMDLNNEAFPYRGNVGVALRNPSATLHVNGMIAAAAKPFIIDHPLDPDNKDLVHAAIEGPEIAVYYRGEGRLVNGEAVIDLPNYFEALTKKQDRTVQLTPVGGWSPLYVDNEIANGKFVVKTAPQGSRAQKFYWEVKAVRADVPELDIEVRKKKPGDKDWHLPTVDKYRRPERFATGAVPAQR